MIKNIMIFLSGCFFMILIFGFLYINYSNYKNEALINGWINILQPYLEKSSLEYKEKNSINLPIKEEVLPHLEFLYIGNDGSLLLKGADNNSILFFYPTIKGGDLSWNCISNSKLKKMGNYICK